MTLSFVAWCEAHRRV